MHVYEAYTSVTCNQEVFFFFFSPTFFYYKKKGGKKPDEFIEPAAICPLILMIKVVAELSNHYSW